MGTYKILPNKDIQFNLNDLIVLNIGLILDNIINIQLWKNDNILIIDYFENGYNKLIKIPVYYFDNSIVRIEINNTTIRILIDDIEEFCFTNQQINYTTNIISTDTNYINMYFDKYTNKNMLVITPNKIKDIINLEIVNEIENYINNNKNL